MANLSPMSWMLARARTCPRSHPPALVGQAVTEIQLWMSVEDNQRLVAVERPGAPRHVQQYLAERRTFGDIWGTENLECFPDIQSPSTDHPPAVKAVHPPITKANHPSAAANHPPAAKADSVSFIHRPSFPRPPVRRPFISRHPHELSLADRVGPAYPGKINSYRPRSRSPARHRGPHPRRDYRSRSPLTRASAPQINRPVSANPGIGSGKSWKQRAEATGAQPTAYYSVPAFPGTSATWSTSASMNASSGPGKPLPCIAQNPVSQGGSTSLSPVASQNALKGLRKSLPSNPLPPKPLFSTPSRKVPPQQNPAYTDPETGKKFAVLKFTNPQAYNRLVGADGRSLSEIGQFFPALVIHLIRPPPVPGASGSPHSACLWLQIKNDCLHQNDPQSDPRSDGVCWQMLACRRGFEAYYKLDQEGKVLPDFEDFYYANREIFHHSHTLASRDLRVARRPRSREEFLAQVGFRSKSKKGRGRDEREERLEASLP